MNHSCIFDVCVGLDVSVCENLDLNLTCGGQ